MLQYKNNQWQEEVKPFVPFLNNGADISYPAVEIDPLYSISQIKESVALTGTAVAGEVGGLTAISVTGATDSAIVTSYGQASINGGQWARVSIAAKVDPNNLPTGSKNAIWGAFTGNVDNGYFWGVDATGLFVGYAIAGVITTERPATLPTDYANVGYTYQIEWTGDNFAPVKFSILSSQSGYLIPVFSYVLTLSAPSIDPNLPIKIVLESDGTAGATFRVLFGARSIHQSHPPRFGRISTEVRRIITVGSAAIVGLLALRPKSTFRGRVNTVLTQFNQISISSRTNGVTLWLAWNPTNLGTIAPAGWRTINNQPVDESSIEGNITLNATAPVMPFVLEAWQIAPNQHLNISLADLPLPPVKGNILLAAQSVNATATVESALSIAESF